MIVGITGNYCSGKNFASLLFQKHGYTLIDVDKIGHEVLVSKQDEIIYTFGEKILKDGLVDRKSLGRIIFNNCEEKKRLESIVHPQMIKRIKEIIKKERDVVINAALLVEMCLFVLCDFVIGISAHNEVAVMRAMARDKISREDVERRLKSQIPLKEKLHFVDKVIDNNGNKKEFKRRVEETIENLH